MSSIVFAQRPDVSNFTEDLLMIQTVFESRHGSVALADETRKRRIGLHLHFMRTKVGRMQTLSYRTSAAVLAMTYGAIRLKNALSIHIPAGSIRTLYHARLGEK